MRSAKMPIPFYARPWVSIVPFVIVWGIGLIIAFASGGIVPALLFAGIMVLTWFKGFKPFIDRNREKYR
jgi:hypothetical protein